MGGGSLSFRRPQLKAGHLFPSSAELKKAWNWADNHPVIIRCWMKHKDSIDEHKEGDI